MVPAPAPALPPLPNSPTAVNVPIPLITKVACQEHRYVWVACGAQDAKEACPVQGVAKIDIKEGKSEKWLPEAHEFLGEVRAKRLCCVYCVPVSRTSNARMDAGFCAM